MPTNTRIKCGCCGGFCRGQVQGSPDGKIAHWRCSRGSATNCGIKGIRGPELMESPTIPATLKRYTPRRFARNTVDSLTTIRQPKENGIEVYFEKENI